MNWQGEILLWSFMCLGDRKILTLVLRKEEMSFLAVVLAKGHSVYLEAFYGPLHESQHISESGMTYRMYLFYCISFSVFLFYFLGFLGTILVPQKCSLFFKVWFAAYFLLYNPVLDTLFVVFGHWTKSKELFDRECVLISFLLCHILTDLSVQGSVLQHPLKWLGYKKLFETIESWKY